MIEISADFYADTKRLIFIPILFFFIKTLAFILWAVGIVYVLSLGEVTAVDAQYQTRRLEYTKDQIALFWAMVFGFFWVEAWLSSANSFVVIVSAVTWYFFDGWHDHDEEDLIPGEAEVYKGFKWALLYHGGSLAFGTIILPIVYVLKTLFSYIAEKLEDEAERRPVMRIVFCCCNFCLHNTEFFIRYISDTAYVHVALSSENFCTSALHSFIVILKNLPKFTFVTVLADLYMFFSQVIISLMSAGFVSVTVHLFSDA